MTSVSGPQFRDIVYADYHYGRDKFEGNEFREIQDFANKVARRIANEPSFSLVFGVDVESACLSTYLAASAHLQVPNTDPHRTKWEVFKQSPSISDLKVPKCILDLFKRLEPSKGPAPNYAPLYIKFNNPVQKVQEQPPRVENKSMRGVICGCIPVVLEATPNIPSR